MSQEANEEEEAPNTPADTSDKKPSLKSIGKTALLIGVGAAVIAVVLFILSNALDDRATDLLLEGTFEEYTDAKDMADFTYTAAWVALVVAIPCIVVGLIAYTSYRM